MDASSGYMLLVQQIKREYIMLLLSLLVMAFATSSGAQMDSYGVASLCEP